MDDEGAPNDLGKQDYIGATEFVLGHVVSSPDQRCVMPVKAKKGKPQVVITAEEKKRTQGATAILKLTGHFQKSTEIFFIVWKQLSPGNFKPVYKSEGQPQLGGR